MAKGAKERNLKASADAIRKVLGEKPIKAEDKYSVELEKLLHDLEERRISHIQVKPVLPTL
jgi:hypothetical protein